jgi:hypothetical protein
VTFFCRRQVVTTCLSDIGKDIIERSKRQARRGIPCPGLLPRRSHHRIYDEYMAAMKQRFGY